MGFDVQKEINELESCRFQGDRERRRTRQGDRLAIIACKQDEASAGADRGPVATCFPGQCDGVAWVNPGGRDVKGEYLRVGWCLSR